jgi:hypothetical protein
MNDEHPGVFPPPGWILRHQLGRQMVIKVREIHARAF